jgi:CzcA family heavy metal efflux pump
MWIVKLALRRPYTVATLCLVIALMGGLSLFKLKTDVLPAIDIPVVIVVWSYPGLTPDEMEKRVITLTERAFSTTVADIEKLESQSINGVGIVKVYFQQGTNIGGAIAQISAVCNAVLRSMPPGITPPFILQFNASNVPVAQLTLSGEQGASEQQLFDYGLNQLRLRLFTVPGLATPAPYGGRQRQVVVDIDPRKLAAQGLSPQDVVDAINRNNVILPAGTARIGQREWDVQMNASPVQIAEFNELPIRNVGNRVVLMRDVANVHDGYATQANIVRVDGRRATFLNILKKADASTLTVVDTVRDMLPSLQKAAPSGVELKLEFDQSEFVRAAVHEVLREGLLAAVLVSLMILFFLGSWRSTLIVLSSIPIAILVSVVGLFLCGQTLNLMTLGGLALAIGMLVDDATVEVENIHRNRSMGGKGLTRAILDGAHQIAIPALAATLTICIVFFPVVLLTGASKFLFVPLALAVVFAMLASYLLSRTLVPTLARMLLEKDNLHEKGTSRAHRFNEWRDKHFDKLRDKYAAALQTALEHGKLVFGAMALLVVCAVALAFGVGLDFFPTVDTGMMRLHYRAPIGTRIESAELYVDQVDKKIREVVPAEEIESITDNLGVPINYNLGFVQTDNAAGNDAEIRVQLKKKHRPTAEYQDKLREALPKNFPGSTFYFLSADIVSQVLNFGLASAIDVEVLARNKPEEQRQAVQKVFAAVQGVPGAVDVHVTQALDHPALKVNVDRQAAVALGLTERDVANSLLTSLSSSALTAPSFWVDPKTGVNYNVIVQTPLPQVATVDDLYSTPITPQGGTPQGRAGNSPFLGSIAQIETTQDKASISHDTVQPVVEIQASVAHRDLGATAAAVQKAVDKLDLPDGVTVKVRGQAESMNAAFSNMGLGMLLALGLVYLLLVILFQSWLDPLIIAVAVPGALVGVLWMLAITGTTLNVESMMGAIMAIGIATSNSILLVSFANDRRAEAPEISPLQAMMDAGRTRLRPVLMTALAMILGMLPMALGLGEGGEQNAPLGRAVIGGLLVATFVTLFFVPVTYSALRKKMPRKQELEDRFRKEEADGQEPEPAHA